jgi:hypothetical protein
MPKQPDKSAPGALPDDPGLPPAELRKRKREAVIVCLSLLAIVILTLSLIHI